MMGGRKGGREGGREGKEGCCGMRAFAFTIIYMFLLKVAVAHYPLSTDLTATRHCFILCHTVLLLVFLSSCTAIYFPVTIPLNLTSCV